MLMYFKAVVPGLSSFNFFPNLESSINNVSLDFSSPSVIFDANTKKTPNLGLYFGELISKPKAIVPGRQKPKK